VIKRAKCPLIIPHGNKDFSNEWSWWYAEGCEVISGGRKSQKSCGQSPRQISRCACCFGMSRSLWNRVCDGWSPYCHFIKLLQGVWSWSPWQNPNYNRGGQRPPARLVFLNMFSLFASALIKWRMTAFICTYVWRWWTLLSVPEGEPWTGGGWTKIESKTQWSGE
jgi:hypothetical protein